MLRRDDKHYPRYQRGYYDCSFALSQAFSLLAALLPFESCAVIGDFTKYGQPVPRPDPTWGVGIAHYRRFYRDRLGIPTRPDHKVRFDPG